MAGLTTRTEAEAVIAAWGAAGRLRDDAPGGGRLVLAKVEAYFAAVVAALTEKAAGVELGTG